jgi:hypothetical protein
MTISKFLVRLAVLGLAFSPLAAPAALADVVVGQARRGCADNGQPGLIGFVVDEPAPVPGGRASDVRFRANFNRVVARGEGVCLKLTLGGRGLRALVNGGGGVMSVNGVQTIALAVSGDGTDAIAFSLGRSTRTSGIAMPSFYAIGTTLMTAAGVGTLTVEQINADGGVLGLAQNVQVQVAATPRPMMQISRPVLLRGQVGEGTIYFENFQLARDLTIQTLVSDTTFSQALAYRPVAGGAYAGQYMYRVADGSQVDGRFYYKAISNPAQRQIVSFRFNNVFTLPAPQVTVNPVPNCGSKPQIFQLQPDGSRVADCIKVQIQPLPLIN